VNRGLALTRSLVHDQGPFGAGDISTLEIVLVLSETVLVIVLETPGIEHEYDDSRSLPHAIVGNRKRTKEQFNVEQQATNPC